MTIVLSESADAVDWDALSELYRLAPLGNKSPDWLRQAFGNSMFKCFAYDGGRLVAAGRALADGVDCAYLCDIAVLPGYQGGGIGGRIIARLVERARGHRKIILYAVPGREPFYRRFGFRRMRTAMAIFEDPARAARDGYIELSEDAT